MPTRYDETDPLRGRRRSTLRAGAGGADGGASQAPGDRAARARRPRRVARRTGHPRHRGAGRTARNRQDHRRAPCARVAAVGPRPPHRRGGAASARRPRRGDTHGGAGRGTGRQDGRLLGAWGATGVGRDPHRGGDRGVVPPPAPERPDARRRRGGAAGRVPRALAGRRPGTRAAGGRAGVAAAGPPTRGHVGDHRPGAGGGAARDRGRRSGTGDRGDRTDVRGRDPLPGGLRPRSDSRSAWQQRCASRCATTTATSWCSCRAGPRSTGSNGSWHDRGAGARSRSTSWPCTAPCHPRNRRMWWAPTTVPGDG